VFPNFCQKNNNIKQTLMVYKVPPGDIFANNYGRGHMKPSHQVSYDMRLPPNKKIPVKNDQYIQGTPCIRQPHQTAPSDSLIRHLCRHLFEMNQTFIALSFCRF
jgi:hypothetical protein